MTKHIKRKKKNNNDDDEDNDSDFSEGIPECIDNDEWKAFLVNPLEAHRLHEFTKKCLQSNEQHNDKKSSLATIQNYFQEYNK